MLGTAYRRGAAVAAASVVMSASAWSQDAQLFERLRGGWAGGGTVRLLNGGNEPIRCRGRYSAAGSTELHLELDGASDSFKLQIASDLARTGDRVTGTWREATFGASGEVNGSIRAERVDAVVNGLGVSARISMTLHGNVQAVTLASQGQLSGVATVQLRRQ